ncbi:putative hemolysin [Dysgonomonas hofstadii]|uniref:Putative hemolysin n=1 Tax=Dysgonomonas hofstadii TaxID=637886 RepID=A0A840CQI8_9BACT|nr:1-acyl-sn-glycerol-3-phosphate acyltransferase [Dysgonomonas hofstadii]MBB4034832.1 putative hemolysin [Dysgonomonas hofstadii]
MQSRYIAKVDIAQFFAEQFPGKKFPAFVVNLIRKILREKDINTLFINAPGKKNLDFIDSCMEQLRFSCNVVGKENLPAFSAGKFIFVSNHPQGGAEAICMAYILGHQYNGNIKFYANEFLTILEPLKEMFLPIYKHQRQNRDNIHRIKEFYETDYHLIVFPAGVTAYKSKGKITDHEWHKNFIKEAINYQRDVVPLYFEARNSNLFYCIENFRKRIRSKVNFEVLLFANEFFKQRGNTFTLYIGRPIPWQTFGQVKNHKEWADRVREVVFNLPEKG